MRINIKTSAVASKPIDRAANPGRAAVKDMGMDHSRLHAAMAQKFLDGVGQRTGSITHSGGCYKAGVAAPWAAIRRLSGKSGLDQGHLCRRQDRATAVCRWPNRRW